MSSGAASHSKGRVFNEWGDFDEEKRHDLSDSAQQVTDWLIDHIVRSLRGN